MQRGFTDYLPTARSPSLPSIAVETESKDSPRSVKIDGVCRQSPLVSSTLQPRGDRITANLRVFFENKEMAENFRPGALRLVSPQPVFFLLHVAGRWRAGFSTRISGILDS